MQRPDPASDLQRAAERQAAAFASPRARAPARRTPRALAVAALAALALGVPLAVWVVGWQPEPAAVAAPRGAAFPWDRAPSASPPPTGVAAAAGPALPASAVVPTCAGDACDAGAMRRAVEAATAAALRPDLVGAFGATSDWTAWWAAQASDPVAAGAPLPVFPAVGGAPPAPSAATTDDGRPE